MIEVFCTTWNTAVSPSRPNFPKEILGYSCISEPPDKTVLVAVEADEKVIEAMRLDGKYLQMKSVEAKSVEAETWLKANGRETAKIALVSAESDVLTMHRLTVEKYRWLTFDIDQINMEVEK